MSFGTAARIQAAVRHLCGYSRSADDAVIAGCSQTSQDDVCRTRERNQEACHSERSGESLHLCRRPKSKIPRCFAMLSLTGLRFGRRFPTSAIPGRGLCGARSSHGASACAVGFRSNQNPRHPSDGHGPNSNLNPRKYKRCSFQAGKASAPGLRGIQGFHRTFRESPGCPSPPRFLDRPMRRTTETRDSIVKSAFPEGQSSHWPVLYATG